MPDGRTHDKVTVVLGLSLGTTACLIFGLRHGSVFTMAFVFSGLLFNGDLDHEAGASCYRRWWILRYLFWPYMKLIPHRSLLSHGPILGTAGRLLYVGVFAAVGLAYPVYREVLTIDDIVNWARLYEHELLLMVAGLEAGSLSHTIADWTLK